MWQYICDHNSEKTRLVFILHCYKQEEHFSTRMKKCSPHLNNVLTLPCEKWNITFHKCTLRISPTASSMVWNIKFIKYRENKLTVTRYVQNVHNWYEHKQASVLAIGQLRHQSATAPSLATYAADAVATYRCHDSWTWQWRHIYVTCKINK